MQNKFGLKDLVLLLVMLAVGATVWLSMLQRDREWAEIRQTAASFESASNSIQGLRRAVEDDLASSLRNLGNRLDEMQQKLDSGVVARIEAPAAAGTTPAAAPDAGTQVASGPRDESWARPGVPVTWPEPFTFVTDPRSFPDFAEGGEFTEIFEAQPPKIMPFLSQDVYGRRVTDRVLESLADYDPATLRMKGVLADAWQMDPEGLWLRVKINPRARFSDGHPVTAEDVRWTLVDFIQNPEIDADRVRSTLDMITGVEVINPQVVEFTFKEPMFSNLESALTFYICPKHFYSQFTPGQINKATGLTLGSGPFKLQSVAVDNQWTPPNDIVLVRNEQYWAGRRHPLASLRFRAIKDELARLTSYRNGEGSMIQPSSPQFARLSKDESFVAENQTPKWINMRSGYAFIAWQCGPRNGKLTPFADKRVRLAMSHMLDRERMIRDIWEGIGELGTQPANPASPAYDPTIQPVPYDLDKAKALLTEAGWVDRNGDGVLDNENGDPFNFEFTYSAGGEVAERVAKYIQSQAALVGIRCTPNPVDWSIYTDILSSRNFDSLIMGWSANAPESDPNQIWHSRSIQNQGDNFIQWGDPEADRLIEAGRRELDFDKRMELWHALHRRIAEEQPYTFVRVVPWFRFIDKDFGNVQTYRKGLEIPEFYRRAERMPAG